MLMGLIHWSADPLNLSIAFRKPDSPMQDEKYVLIIGRKREEKIIYYGMSYH